MMEIADTMPMILQLSLPENVLPLIFPFLIRSKITKSWLSQQFPSIFSTFAT
jgi:hypothetical protein